MSDTSPNTFSRVWSWFCGYALSTFVASDFILGAVIGASSGLFDEYSKAFRGQALVVLITDLALGVALLGVVLAALAIIVAFDDAYLRVLDKADPDGFRAVLDPFRVTAFTSALTAVISGLGNAAVLIGPVALGAVGIGLSTFFAVWSVWGTFKLAQQLIENGVQRARLMAAVGEAQERLRRHA